jgi:NADH-quinone oxidoreductase subunit N
MSPIPAINDLYALLPFILLTISSLMFLIFQFIFHSKDRWFLRFLTLIMLAVVAVLVFRSSNNPGYGKYFNGQLKISELTIWLNVLYLATAFITVVVSPIISKEPRCEFS